MIDQLIIDSSASYDDFEASVRERQIDAPKKKSIKETVPFSNVTYDFSAIDGEVYWEERTLKYVFEITADTPEELEVQKIKFKSWIMNVSGSEIHDPFISEYHFIGTFDSIAFDDSEIEKSTITVAFTAYPYMIANQKTEYEFSLSTSVDVVVEIVNNSSHRITPTFISDVPVTFQIGDTTHSMGAGEATDDSIKLAVGANSIKIQPTEAAGTFKVEFYEEVF